jgi:hypothetical protein
MSHRQLAGAERAPILVGRGSAGRRLTVLPVAVLVTLALVVAGCGSGTAASPSASAAGGANCSQTRTRIPVLIDSQDSVGSDRFLFSFIDEQNKPISAPDLKATVAFYDLAKSPTTPIARVDGQFIWAIEGQRGIYHVTTDFTDPGDWMAQFTSTKSGVSETTCVTFPVSATSSTPRIGDKAPVTKTPTLADAGGDPKRISTDPNPDPSFYRLSVDRAIAEHKPFVLIFATPAFCKSSQCGPTLDAIKVLAKKEPRIAFIHVEPYKLEYTDGRLQPVLANNELQSTDVTNAWGLLSEPWIFVVDGTGIVRGSFSTIVGADELTAAIKAAT